MANVFSIHSVGESIVRLLRDAYPQTIGGTSLPACTFELVSSGQINTYAGSATRLTLYLYRTSVRDPSRSRDPVTEPAPLLLDLHFLLSAWASNPLDEQVAMAWAMRELHQHPVLGMSQLSANGGWAESESIEITPMALSNEDLMRIWNALEPAYRLSAAYVARIVRLDPDGRRPAPIAQDDLEPVISK